MSKVRTVIVELEHPMDDDSLRDYSDEYYGIGRELIRCNECKHKTRCYSDVVMTDKRRTADIYESVQWCSLGERGADNG